MARIVKANGRGGAGKAGVGGKRGNSGKRMALIAGKRPQLRRATAGSWTKAKEEVFLAVLAETCNVSCACAVAGVGVTSVYRRKKENAAFRAAWLTAVSIAYQQLELAMLERAFNGTDKVVAVRAGEPVVMRQYSSQLGIALLKMHRETAMEAEMEVPPNEIEEVRERLIRKLQRMKARDEGDQGDQGDRKGGDDRSGDGSGDGEGDGMGGGCAG